MNDCRHCGRVYAYKPRGWGLCWTCHQNLFIRVRYVRRERFSRRGVLDRMAVPLPEPTAALPGTPEKVAVLEARAMAGTAIFHPHDAQRATA